MSHYYREGIRFVGVGVEHLAAGLSLARSWGFCSLKQCFAAIAKSWLCWRKLGSGKSAHFLLHEVEELNFQLLLKLRLMKWFSAPTIMRDSVGRQMQAAIASSLIINARQSWNELPPQPRYLITRLPLLKCLVSPPQSLLHCRASSSQVGL
jgi:hypothetical protein